MSQDEDNTRKNNVEATSRKIENQLKRWSRGYLSILGKVLIVKTFGISQIIYLMQSMCLKSEDFKLLILLLYKFIWNKNYQAAKAPERIRREIVNKPVKLGGLGMLDIKLLDESLKLKALGRLLETDHPYLKLVRNKLVLDDFFNPNLTTKIDEMAQRGVKLLSLDRNLLLKRETLDGQANFIRALKSIQVRRILGRNGVNSLAWFNLRRTGGSYAP